MTLLPKLGSLVYHWRKTILVLWAIAALVLSVFAVKLPSVLSGNGFDIAGDAAQVETELFDTFNIPDCTLIVLFQSESLTADNVQFKGLVGTVLTEVAALPEITSVRSPYQHAEMMHDHVAFAVLAVDGEVKEAISQVRDIIAEQADPDIQMQLTGEPVVEVDINQASQQDLVRAELIGIPTALIILLLAFGSVVAACIPLLIGVVAVTMAMGALYLIDTSVELSIFILNVTPMIGLALSIDFALLIVSRFREQLNHHDVDIKQAIITAVATAGHSIALSGLCMFLGLSALLFFQIEIFLNIALGGMIVVSLAVLSALTLLPALLAVLGHKIDAGRLFKVKAKKRSYWSIWAWYVLKRPVRILLLALLVLLACLLPLREIQLHIPEYTTLPASFESREALETIENTFGSGEVYPVNIIATTDGDVMELANLEALKQLINELTAEPEVERVESLFSYLENRAPQEIYYLSTNPATKELIAPVVEQLTKGNKTLINVYLNISPTSAAARDWVLAWSEKPIADVSILLGGKTKFEQEIYTEIRQKVPYAMTFILVFLFIILLVAFRSLIIPIKAILMNILSLSATFGILVWIFQMGHLDWLLQFEPEPIGVIIPIFIFSIVLCLSIDYEIFLMSRVYEVYRKTGNHNTAIYVGLLRTSRVITSAAVIIIVITGAFAFTGVVIVKQMGLGTALAILIDATLVRMIIVPAVLKLLGKWSWWLPFISLIRAR